MKTAEDWINELEGGEAPHLYTQVGVASIRAIQADAHTQGMRDAAGLLMKRRERIYLTNGNPIAAMNAGSFAEEILSAIDKKTP